MSACSDVFFSLLSPSNDFEKHRHLEVYISTRLSDDNKRLTSWTSAEQPFVWWNWLLLSNFLLFFTICATGIIYLNYWILLWFQKLRHVKWNFPHLKLEAKSVTKRYSFIKKLNEKATETKIRGICSPGLKVTKEFVQRSPSDSLAKIRTVNIQNFWLHNLHTTPFHGIKSTKLNVFNSPPPMKWMHLS